MVHAVFYDIGTYDIDHPIVSLISSVSVDITGTINYPHTNCPSVSIKRIEIEGNSVKYTVYVIADIIKEVHSGVEVTVTGTLPGPAVYDVDGIRIAIHTSGISVDSGIYDTDFVVRLNNITIHPRRSITVNTNPGTGRIMVNSGYNVAVTMSDTVLNIMGSPGAGKGKYIVGGLDNLYQGIRSINGINLSNNINIKLSDALISDGGSV